MTRPPARTGERCSAEYFGRQFPGRILSVHRTRIAISFDHETEPRAPIVAARRVTIHRACGDVRAIDCTVGFADPCA